MKTLEERLWPKIIKTDTCWLWTGGQSRGYGHILNVNGRKQGERVHRVVYELLVGPIPDGLHIDHLCRVPLCCNPEHLEPVTQRENTLRGIGHTAVNARKTHCSEGHEYTPENTYHRPSQPNKRECRICRLKWQRAGRARRIAARPTPSQPKGPSK